MSMCANCRRAGQIVSWAKRDKLPASPLQTAVGLHHACEYPESCTCQHLTALNLLNEGQPT